MIRLLSRLIFMLLILQSCVARSVALPTQSALEIKPPIKEIWVQQCNDQIEDICIKDTIIAFSTFETIGALDLATGKKLWEKSFAEKGFSAYIDCSNGTLYASIGELKLSACNIKTGKELWSLKRRGFASNIVVHGSALYCELNSGTLAAIDLKTKRTKWTLKLDDPKLAEKQNRDSGLSSKPQLIEKRLYLASEAGEILCLNPASGKAIWRYKVPAPIGESSVSVCGFTMDSRRVYATHDFGAIALDALTGKPLWSFVTQDQVSMAPVLFGDSVAFCCWDGNLYAISAETGVKKWSAVISKMGDLSSAAIMAVSNSLLVAALDNLFAFDKTGARIWEEPFQDIAGGGIQPTKKGLIMRGGDMIGLVARGAQPKPPTDPSARLDLAKRFAARFEKLTRSEKRVFMALGDEGFAAMLPVVQQRMDAYNKTARLDDKASSALYERLDAAVETLLAFASPKHTSQLLALCNEAKASDSADSILRWLAEDGDQSLTVPFFLAVMQKIDADKSVQTGENNSFGYALDAIAKLSDPAAVKFLLDKLADPNVNYIIRQAAFTNLARTGGQPGVEAVIAAKDTNRAIPSLEDFIGLQGIPLTLSATKLDPYEYHRAVLLETKTDKNGVIWGLISSPIAGPAGDLWIARQENGKWTGLVYTGAQSGKNPDPNWINKFPGDDKLTKDSDADGWTDVFEVAIGTKPDAADTDGDGLKDSEDKNPLAAPRELNETEQVLAAAFEARFRFNDGSDSPHRVEMPDNIAPFELMGRQWVTLFAHSKDIPAAKGRDERPMPLVSFRPPKYDFDLAKVYIKDKSLVALWNSDKTEAKVHIVAYYGPLAATGFDIRLKKFNGVWVAVEMQMIWIS
ncbi:MAG: PQQ-binding-like beta-propeller repeat protein [Armatimonadetes bacterium]|nr:PQQ-binding-like beta-propeller repeat protein [Armatimonadota bacterium]